MNDSKKILRPEPEMPKGHKSIQFNLFEEGFELLLIKNFKMK